MSVAKKGNNVLVHYTGKLVDGRIFDSTENKDPFSFVIGAGQVIKGFDEGIYGMEIGEEKQLSISSDEAYGPMQSELIVKIEKDKLPSEIEPEVGLQLEVTTQDNNKLLAVISSMDENYIELDANHPLAGQNLIFDVKLVGIE